MSKFRNSLLLCNTVLFLLPLLNAQNCTYENYPYLITLFTGNAKKSFCEGSLLTSKWVLTASHCVYLRSGLISAVTHTKDWQYVDKIYVHPMYDPKSITNDISMLRLNGRLLVSEYAKLAARGFSNSCNQLMFLGILAHQKLQGYTDDQSLICLHTLNLDILFCKSMVPLHPEEKIICSSSNIFGFHPCKGDSGGPILCNGVIIGVASFGMSCSMPGMPTIFTKAEMYLDFYEETVGLHGGKVVFDASEMIYVINGAGCFRGWVVWGVILVLFGLVLGNLVVM